MNEALINPFNISHPTAIQTSLFALGSFARFDPSGRFVGVGRFDGIATIWDLETRAAIRILDGHVKAVTSVEYVFQTALKHLYNDANVMLLRVLNASFSQIILALTATGEVYLQDLRPSSRNRVELTEPEEEGEEDSRRAAMTVARFDPTGKHVFVGTSSGHILVFNTRTKTMIARHKISGAGTLKGLDFAKNGRRLLTNSSDRTLRQFNLPSYPPPGEEILETELEPTHRFSDPITKTAWHAMSYSPDGEWLAGGAADPAGHKIYIWDISNDGQFAQTLDGGREALVHLHWHPSKSSIASTTNQGNILIWHSPSPERWGAFAGGFEEVDENVEYEEKEDEFDIEDEEITFKRKMKAEEDEVDIDTIEEVNSQIQPQPLSLADDEDAIWAETEPDDDCTTWRMRINMDFEDTFL
ncbi:chromatin binding protein [Paramarasmius palmivorus]|uniref:Chromatin binding protein n=1 Tax=Paramarasmius palmivorus TaxID=297713 RepID=A0AAW0E854_9AGAR